MITKTIIDFRFSRLAEADEIGRDAMRNLRDERKDIAPDVGGTRVAMQKKYDGSFGISGFAVSDCGVEDF